MLTVAAENGDLTLEEMEMSVLEVRHPRLEPGPDTEARGSCTETGSPSPMSVSSGRGA